MLKVVRRHHHPLMIFPLPRGVEEWLLKTVRHHHHPRMIFPHHHLPRGRVGVEELSVKLILRHHLHLMMFHHPLLHQSRRVVVFSQHLLLLLQA